MIRFLITLLLLPSLAFAADVKPQKSKINNICTSYAMCVAETGTGECQDASDTDEIVHHVGFRAEYVVYSTKSTATDYSCDIFTSNEGFNGATATDQVNTTSITDEEPVYTMTVLLRHVWFNCSTITGGAVTIDMEVCGK
jgi:hypothetical protein